MTPKAIRLTNGGKIINGQAHVPNIARDGAPKRLTVPAIAHGMRDVGAKNHPLATAGARRPLDDAPLQKRWQDARSEPIHPGMASPPQRGTDHGPSHGSENLAAGGKLSALDCDPAFDHSHIGHKVHRANTLPASKHRTDK